MNERFENLTAGALRLANDELSHIAETAQLTDAETARIMQLAKKKAGFVQQTAKPIAHKKRFRTLGVLIAAAVAAVCATVGVSAYVNRNNEMLHEFFGKEGAAQFSLAELPEPVQYYNDNACITVETVMNDGMQVTVLVSGTLPDGTPYDWHGVGGLNTLHAVMVDADGSYVFKNFGGHGFDFFEHGEDFQEHDPETWPGPKYYAYNFYPDEFTEDEEIYLIFEPYDKEVENPLEGIRIPMSSIIIEQNVPLNTYVSDSGEQIYLSNFEFVCDKPIDEEETFPVAYLISNDGARHTLYPDGGAGKPIQAEDGTDLTRYYWRLVIPNDEADWADVDFTQPILPNKVGDPALTISFIDANEVKAIELDGVLYTKQ